MSKRKVKRATTTTPKPPTLARDKALRIAAVIVANQAGEPVNPNALDWGSGEAGGLCEHVKTNGIHDGANPCGAEACKCAGIAANLIEALEELGALKLKGAK